MAGRRFVLVLAAMLGFVAMGVADAASLGPLTSSRLNAFSGSGPSGAPTVVAFDTFTGVDGTSLSGRALVIGNTWTVAAGNWLINANTAVVNGVAFGRAVTTTSLANARIVVTVADADAGGHTSGVVFRSDPLAATYLYAYTQSGSGGRLHLAKRAGIASTVLTTATGIALTNPSQFVVELNGASVKVSYNGVAYINYTLSAADQLTYGSLTTHGMLNDNAGTVRFDDFRVESL